MTCADPLFPLNADIYYATTEQAAYGNIKKTWVLDKTLQCYFGSVNQSNKDNVKAEYNIVTDFMILGRVKTDIRESNREELNAVTNIIVTNIRNASDEPVYTETSGPRRGKSTIFEIASFEPFIGPFSNVEYYSVTLRRSENQAVDI